MIDSELTTRSQELSVPQPVEGLRFITIATSGEGKPTTFRKIAVGGENLNEGLKLLKEQMNKFPDGLSFIELQKKVFSILPLCNLYRADD